MLKFYHAPGRARRACSGCSRSSASPTRSSSSTSARRAACPKAIATSSPTRRCRRSSMTAPSSPSGQRSASTSPTPFPRPAWRRRSATRRARRYLTWLVYCDSVFDPAVAARRKAGNTRATISRSACSRIWCANVEKLLSRAALSPQATALPRPTRNSPAGINFTMNILKVLPALPAFLDYVAPRDRPAGLPAYVAKDMELAKKVTPPPFAGTGRSELTYLKRECLLEPLLRRTQTAVPCRS